MSNFSQQFQRDGKKVTLLKSEKDQILNRILAAPVGEPKKKWSWNFFGVFANPKFTITALLALLILVSVPITHAAQKSGPGNVLHGFELSVIEPIEQIIQFSPNAQVSYATNRLEERLDELQAASQDKITEEQIAIANENIQGHVNEALVSIPESPKKEVISHFVKVSALLHAHENVIAEVDQTKPIITGLTDQVENQLSNQVEEYAQDQTPGELAQTVQQEVQETAKLLADQPQDSDTIVIAKQLEGAQEELSQGDYEEALQEVIDAKVQALAQDYLDPADKSQ